MKKVIALVLVSLMLLSLMAGCSGKDDKADAGGNTPGTSTSGTTETSSAPPSPTTSYDAPDSAAGGRTEASDAAVIEAAPSGENVRFADEIKIITDGGAATLDPFRGGSPSQMWSFNLMYDRLLYYIGGGKYDPSLATDWHTDDYKTFTFDIRKDVVFHNGEKLTAHDVVFSFNWGRDPEHSTNTTWGLVDTIEALDDYKVKIVLKSMDVDFIFRISQPNIAIVNEKALTDDPLNGMLIGTGAFSLSEFVENNYMVFERNDNYWSKPAITKKITMVNIPELSSRTIMLLNGEVQICLKTSGDDMDLFVDNPDYWIDDHVVNNPTLIRFNMADKITGDYNFRMAVAHAINRYDLALVGGGGWYFPDYESGSPWGYSTEFRNLDVPMIPEGDLDAARDFLAKSTYDGSAVEILTTSLISTVRASEVLQQQLKVVGIETEIHEMDGVSQTEYTKWGNNQAQIILGPIAFTAAAYSIRRTFTNTSPTTVTKQPVGRGPR